MIQLTAEQPAADAWFAARGWSPFPFQRQVWPVSYTHLTLPTSDLV